MADPEAQLGRRCSASEAEEDRGACSPDEDCPAAEDIESGGAGENKVNFVGMERDCRICHLSLFSSSPARCGPAIELGCACKDDLAAAHKHCADTWFKIRGNKTCEICNSTAENVVGPIDIDFAQETDETSIVGSTESGPSNGGAPSRRCLNGHRFLNILLASIVFAFVVSWLLHFNIPS